jgi:hypothetical protein
MTALVLLGGHCQNMINSIALKLMSAKKTHTAVLKLASIQKVVINAVALMDTSLVLMENLVTFWIYVTMEKTVDANKFVTTINQK